MLTLFFANICACHWRYHFPWIWYMHWMASGGRVIYPSKTVPPPVKGSTTFIQFLCWKQHFFGLDEIGKYCLFLSVFSSIFCNHVECSSYIYLYILYNILCISKRKRKAWCWQKDPIKPMMIICGTTLCNHCCFSHTENWEIKAVPKYRDFFYLYNIWNCQVSWEWKKEVSR